jgi:hypothetical protein
VKVWTDPPDAAKGAMTNSYEHGNEPSSLIREFLDQLSDCQLLTKDPVPWSQLLDRRFVTPLRMTHEKNSTFFVSIHSEAISPVL